MPSHVHTSLVRDAISMRDALTHRGPDDAGLWADHSSLGCVVLAHRRLAVRDTSHAGVQPMRSRNSVIVYNGEIYNQPDVHATFDADSLPDPCDTATVLGAMDINGASALRSFRGMYALAHYELHSHSLTLARDPMGIKPLYWTIIRVEGHDVVAFASEIAGLLAHPNVTRKPDPVTISSYLTTIRTTLGERTLLDGVRTLLPGQTISFRYYGNTLQTQRERIEVDDIVIGVHAVSTEHTFEEAVDLTREAVTRSIHAHLPSDVPICCLLSGGLDSSIIASVLSDRLRQRGTLGSVTSSLATWCAASDEAETDDLVFARTMASHLRTEHHEVIVSRDMFLDQWLSMIRRSCVPLSTPNEIAIAEIARDMRSNGYVVAMSGEGADELFGGYDQPLSIITDAFRRDVDVADDAELDILAWMPTQIKPMLMTESAFEAAEHDANLVLYIRDTVRSARDFAKGKYPGDTACDLRLRAHLEFSTKSNLVGLLQRLDTSLMQHSIEGRTPFADAGISQFASSLSVSDRFHIDTDGVTTKRVLRHGFAGVLPESIVQRSKRSFPLPFREWIASASDVLRESEVVRTWIKPEIVDAISDQPAQHWRLAWPIMNLAIWGERMFGDTGVLERMHSTNTTTVSR